jgi:hypothetical protein
MNTKPKPAEDQNPLETDTLKKWQVFKEFARKVITLPKEEVDRIKRDVQEPPDKEFN